MERGSSPFIIFVAFRWTLSCMSVSLLHWGAQNWTQDSRCDLTSAELERKDQLSQPASNTLLNAAWDAICRLCSKGTLLTQVQLSVHQDPLFSVKLLSSWVALSIYWYMRLFLPRCRTLYFFLLNFIRFLSTHFSNLLICLWMAAQPSGISATVFSFVSSANLLRVHFAQSPDR